MDKKQLTAYIKNSLEQTAKNLLDNNAVPVITIGLNEFNEIVLNVSNDKYSKDQIIMLLSQSVDGMMKASPIIKPNNLFVR